MLDNTQRGEVTGWLAFRGLPALVRLRLEGDFHRDIRGAQLVLRPDTPILGRLESERRMEGFATRQTGQAGDITAGLEPVDYVDYPYVEWYSEQNGRVVLELSAGDIEVVGAPVPWQGEPPLDREELDARLHGHVRAMAESLGGVAAVVTPVRSKK